MEGVPRAGRLFMEYHHADKRQNLLRGPLDLTAVRSVITAFGPASGKRREQTEVYEPVITVFYPLLQNLQQHDY
jgi:hypothetical protein